MTVTWTNGYNMDEATPLVEWGWKGHNKKLSPTGTLTFTRDNMCGMISSLMWISVLNIRPIIDSIKTDIFDQIKIMPSCTLYLFFYDYQNQCLAFNCIHSTLGMRVTTIVGWRDPGFIHTCFLKDLWPNTRYAYMNIEWGICSKNGYTIWSKSYSFNSSPYPGQDSFQRVIIFGDMGKAGRSFYNTPGSGGECGVPAETMYYVPAENRAKFWYSSDYGMFHYCRVDSEHNWQEGSEQYAWIEKCLASVDRNKKTMNQCVNSEISHYSGTVNGTIHVVVGGGGSHLSEFTKINTFWSLYKDHDWGFVKLTAFNHSLLLFEYKKSADGEVYDSFTISRDYKDVLACVHDGCEATTLAT
ncbi:putative phosphodiesterase I [Helianthus debilis subsp. tardiflorus]